MLDRRQQPAALPIDHIPLIVPEDYTMPNGIPVYVVNAGEHDVLRIDVVFQGGKWRQLKPLQAIFTNRMLREGTQQFTRNELAERLDFYGAWLELSVTSSMQCITLYTLSKYLPQTLELLRSMVLEPTFPEGEFEVVRANNLQEFLVNKSKSEVRANRALLRTMYGASHPNGVLAEEADYQALTTDDLRSFYAGCYAAANCTVYLSGKATDDARRLLEECFGTQSFGVGKRAAALQYVEPTVVADKRTVVSMPDAWQSSVRMGMHSLPVQHADLHKFRVVMTIFGGYFGSRLMKNVREEKGYTYGIYAALTNYPQSALLTVSAECAPTYVEPLIAEVYGEIDRMQHDLVADDELQRVRNYMCGELCRTVESVLSLPDIWMFMHGAGLSAAFHHDSVHAIQTITPYEVRDLARRYLCADEFREVVARQL